MKYRNKTEYDQVIPGVGTVAANGIIETNGIIENPNLEPIDEKETVNRPVQGVAPQQPPVPVEAPKEIN